MDIRVKVALGYLAWLILALTGAYKGFLFFADLVNGRFAVLLSLMILVGLMPLLSNGGGARERLARLGAHVLNVGLFTALFAAGISAKLDDWQVADLRTQAVASSLNATLAKSEAMPDSAELARLDGKIAAALAVIASNSMGVSTGKRVSEMTNNCTQSGYYYRQYCQPIIVLQVQRKQLSEQLSLSDKAGNLQQQASQTVELANRTADKAQLGRNLGFVLKMGQNDPLLLNKVIVIAVVFALLLDVTAGFACGFIHAENPLKAPDSRKQAADTDKDSGKQQVTPLVDVASEPLKSPVRALSLVETAVVAGAERLAELKHQQSQKEQQIKQENKPVFFDAEKFMRNITVEQVRSLLPAAEVPTDTAKADELAGAIVYVCRAHYKPKQAMKVADVLKAVANHSPVAASLVTKHALTTKVLPLLADALHIATRGQDVRGRATFEWAGVKAVELAVKKLHVEGVAA